MGTFNTHICKSKGCRDLGETLAGALSWTAVLPRNVLPVPTVSSERSLPWCKDVPWVDILAAAANEVQTKHQETSMPESRHDFSINGIAGFVTNQADAITKNCGIRSVLRATAAFNWVIFKGARTIKECCNNIIQAEIRNGIRHGILSISNSLICNWLARPSKRMLLGWNEFCRRLWTEWILHWTFHYSFLSTAAL